MLIEAFEALHRFNGEYLQFPPFVAAFDQIDGLLQLFRGTGVAQCLLVLGEAGTGKTTLCKTLLEKYPKIILPERDVIPVLSVPIPPAATIASVAESMLFRLGDPAPGIGTTSNKTARAIRLARACGVELLLFDEANHIQDRGQSPTQYLVGDWVKGVVDELGVPTVLLGLPRVADLLRVNEQLRRRFTRRLHMELGQDPDTPIATQCLQLFTSLTPSLPVPFSKGTMSWEELGQRLHFATDGRVSYLKVLLAGAIRAVFNNAIDELTIADLENAFTEEIWPQGVGALNPFHQSFEFRRLDRQAEPFERGAISGPSKKRGAYAH
jgi:hypothetical protein